MSWQSLEVISGLFWVVYSKFQFQTHINKTCQSAFHYIYNIRHIRKFLSFEAAKTLIHALVISRLDYCNSVLYGTPAIYTNKLQRVQNAAARLLTNTPCCAHLTPVMIDLHWLPVKFRIFKVILFTFKAVHGLAPAYISSLLSPKQSSYNRRSIGNHTLARPKIKSAKTNGDRAFAVAAPAVLWNALPPNLRNIGSITLFKKQLKTHLFRETYF